MSLSMNGSEVSAVQFGDIVIGEAQMNGQTVYTSAQPIVPFELSGTLPARILSTSIQTDLTTSPNFSEQGVFRIEMSAIWGTVNPAAQRLTYSGYTIIGPSEFGVNPISKDHDLRFPPYNVKFQGFSNSSVAMERTIAGGWWKITRIAM